MHQRLKRLLALVLVGALLGLLPGANAGAQEHNDKEPRVEEVSDGQVRADTIVEYAKLFDVSVERSEREIDQRADAQKYLDELSTTHESVFGGFVVDHSGTEMVIRVMIKGESRQAIRDIERAARADGIPFVVKDGMSMSIGELLTQQRAVHESLADAVYSIGSSIDVDTGTIELVVGLGVDGATSREAADAKSQDAVTAALARSVDVENLRIEVVNEAILDEPQHMYGGGNIGIGGTSLLCTAGFAAVEPNGTTGYITAGHCAQNNALAHYSDPYTNDQTVVEVTHYLGWSGDFAYVRSNGHVERPWVFYQDIATIVPIYSSRSAFGFGTGDWACIYTWRADINNVRNNGYGCDQVDEPYYSQTIDGVYYGDLVLTNSSITIGGESGGPWRIGNEALGVHRGLCGYSWAGGSCFSKSARMGAAGGVHIMIGP